MLLNIIEYRGLSWIIVDYRGIAWISTTLVTHIGLRMLLKPLKTQPGRSALRNPCEGCSFHDPSESEKLEKVASRS